jgi:hypothetical protein
VFKQQEMSPRVLALIEICIQLNAGNYTLWQYRRQVLKALNADLRKEMQFLDTIIEETPKNYQVWSVLSVPDFSKLDPQKNSTYFQREKKRMSYLSLSRRLIIFSAGRVFGSLICVFSKLLNLLVAGIIVAALQS